MVENLHFERINQIMKASLGNPKPFGGVQVIGQHLHAQLTGMHRKTDL